MSAPVTTDALYNLKDRIIQQKFIIYFAGDTLVVTKDNYLITSSILEETQSDIESYLGNTTANELDLSLYNSDRIFTPTNSTSRYYGKMVKGLKIEAFMRVFDGIEREWDSMGVFYVTSWVAPADGTVANITADDCLYDIFQSGAPSYLIQRNITHKALFEAFFAAYNVEVVVDNEISTVLPFAYINMDPKTFLTNLSLGAMADCYCNRQGIPYVHLKTRARSLRATITDADQIISVSIDQTIDTGYDGASVTCNFKQESNDTEVLSIKDTDLATGATAYSNVQLTTNLLVRVLYISAVGGAPASIDGISALPGHISFNVQNDNASAIKSTLSVHGTTVETVSTIITDNGDALLSLNSDYVQTLSYAQQVKSYVDRIVTNKIPTLTLSVRGNPLILLGDLVHIVSTRYKLDYYGILIRATYEYNGGLTATMVFAAAQAFLEVS